MIHREQVLMSFKLLKERFPLGISLDTNTTTTSTKKKYNHCFEFLLDNDLFLDLCRVGI